MKTEQDIRKELERLNKLNQDQRGHSDSFINARKEMLEWVLEQ